MLWVYEGWNRNISRIGASTSVAAKRPAANHSPVTSCTWWMTMHYPRPNMYKFHQIYLHWHSYGIYHPLLRLFKMEQKYKRRQFIYHNNSNKIACPSAIKVPAWASHQVRGKASGVKEMIQGVTMGDGSYLYVYIHIFRIIIYHYIALILLCIETWICIRILEREREREREGGIYQKTCIDIQIKRIVEICV